MSQRRIGSFALSTEHRARVTGLLLGVMSATEAFDAHVCVLGAGNCNDLELNVLGQHCHELHLIDLDSAALSRGLANQRLTSGGEDVVEIPGGARLALHGDVDLSAIGLGFDHGAQTDSSVLVERALAGPNTDLGGLFDVAISTTLLTQLISLAVEALGGSHPALTELVFALRNGHLRLLARLLRPGGTALLVTDVVSSDTLPELVAARPEAMERLLHSAVASRNFFTGTNRYALADALRRDSVLHKVVADVSLLGPWRWQIGSKRSYLVVALSFRRI